MRRVKLGDVEFDIIEQENPRDSATVTDNPVESGQDVSDHVKQNPSTISLRGHMTTDAARKLAILQQYKKEGKLLTYIGRNLYHNMVIKDIDRSHGKDNRYGFSFDIKLKNIRIATAKEVPINVANSKAAARVRKPTNKGKQQPKAR